MKVEYFDRNNVNKQESLCACIGFFDGMHKGHQALFAETVKTAGNEFIPAMITFTPDPQEVIAHTSNTHIFSFAERKKLAESFGMKRIIVIPFDEKIMKTAPEAFIAEYLEVLPVKQLICGYDFSFGYQGLGDAGLLKEKASFPVKIIPEVAYEDKKISSTWIRKTIEEGDLGLARELLGFDYYLLAKVTDCAHNGLKWLIKAVPLDDLKVLPKKGIYHGLEIRDHVLSYASDEPIRVGSEIKIVFQDE